MEKLKSFIQYAALTLVVAIILSVYFLRPASAADPPKYSYIGEVAAGKVVLCDKHESTKELLQAIQLTEDKVVTPKDCGKATAIFVIKEAHEMFVVKGGQFRIVEVILIGIVTTNGPQQLAEPLLQYTWIPRQVVSKEQFKSLQKMSMLKSA